MFLEPAAERVGGAWHVLELVEGTTDVAPEGLADALPQMARSLAALHALDVERLSLPPLLMAPWCPTIPRASSTEAF